VVIPPVTEPVPAASERAATAPVAMIVVSMGTADSDGIGLLRAPTSALAPLRATPAPPIVAPAHVAPVLEPIVDRPTEPTMIEPSYSATPTVAIAPLQESRATVLGFPPLREPAAPVAPLPIRGTPLRRERCELRALRVELPIETTLVIRRGPLVRLRDRVVRLWRSLRARSRPRPSAAG
jgi:hypothetical protein